MENQEVVKFNKVPSIVMIIVSFLVGGIIGIALSVASLVTGSGVENLVTSGNVEEAKKKLRTAKTFFTVACVWDAFVALLLVGYIVLLVVANM